MDRKHNVSGSTNTDPGYLLPHFWIRSEVMRELFVVPCCKKVCSDRSSTFWSWMKTPLCIFQSFSSKLCLKSTSATVLYTPGMCSANVDCYSTSQPTLSNLYSQVWQDFGVNPPLWFMDKMGDYGCWAAAGYEYSVLLKQRSARPASRATFISRQFMWAVFPSWFISIAFLVCCSPTRFWSTVADLKRFFQCALDREAHNKGSGGMLPQRKFLISDLLRLFLVPFWGEIARVAWSTAKSSHCVWSL